MEALLADEGLFRSVSDSNVDPAVSIHDRSRAIEYIAHDAVAYRLKEMDVRPRLDKAAVDIVFLVAHPSGKTFLGKGKIRCNPMAISGWTIGSPDKRTESGGLCDPDDSIRLGNSLFCLG